MDMEEALKLAFERNFEKLDQSFIDDSYALSEEVKDVIKKFIENKSDGFTKSQTATSIYFALSSNLIILALLSGIKKEYLPEFLTGVIKKVADGMDYE